MRVFQLSACGALAIGCKGAVLELFLLLLAFPSPVVVVAAIPRVPVDVAAAFVPGIHSNCCLLREPQLRS